MNEIAGRVRQGAFYGAIFACLYSAYSGLLYLLRGPEPFAKDDTTIGAVIAAYFAAGIVAGAIVGGLQPLTRTRIGAAIVYSIAAFFVFVSIAIAADGPHNIWWLGCALLGTAFGVFGSFAWRDMLR